MFHSKKGPLNAIWVAAYCFKKLKKSQVFLTDISSSVDKILQDELNAVTYRVMAYLLLGIARIYSRKVEYLYTDSNKVLTEINAFVVSTKESMKKETFQSPYYAITLPNRFELDAFDLGILEDVTGSNMASPEEITLKDNMWKKKNKVMWSLDENNGEEVTAVDNIFYSDDTFFEDVFSPRLKDYERVASSLHYQIMPELPEGSTFSHEKYEVEVFTGIENAFPNPVELFDEDHQSHEEMLKEEMWQYKNVVSEASNEIVLTDSFCHEENVIIATISRMENESSEQLQSSDEDHQSEGLCRELVQSEKELQIINEGNFSISEGSMEKLRDNIITPVGSMDIDISCGVKNLPLDLVGLDSEGYDLKSLEMKSPEERDHDDISNKLQLAISLDGISDFKFPDFTGMEMPEFITIPTPAKKERSRTSRKRKCIVDDCVVLTNKKLKQSIYDTRDLVLKRRKAPLCALTAWKASLISELSSGFSVPLMSCVSSELKSLLSETRVNTKNSADMVKYCQNLDTSNSSTSAMFERTDCLGTNPQSGDYSDVPDMSASITTSRAEEIMNYTERGSEISVPESLSATEPQNFDRLEQITIAPGTPVRCSTSARSFGSPESPKVSNLNAIKFCEVGDSETDGWSGRTRMVAGCLLQNFTNQGVQSLKEVVKLSDLLGEKTRRDCASVFYEILVLKTRECVDVKQEYAYGDILVWKSLNWDRALGTNLSLTCEDSCKFVA